MTKDTGNGEKINSTASDSMRLSLDVTNQVGLDKRSKNIAVKKAKKQKKALENQQIKSIRAQNEQRKQRALREKQNRKAELVTLGRADRRAYQKTEKARKQQDKAAAQKLLAQQKNEFAALSPAQKKAYKIEQARQRRLQKKARKSYIPLKIIKYTLLAALVGLLVYAGNIAYGMFFDYSFAFRDTGQAVATPTVSRAPSPSPTAQATPTASSTPTPTVDPYALLLSQADLDFMKDRVNILVLGIDESTERADWGSFRTDTMILLSVDFETNKVSMISLPRDSYVWLYNKNCRGKINSAFSNGGGVNGSGFEYAMNTVSMALGGIPVNHYVCFDMNVVKEVVNALGGLYYDVDINVTMNGRKLYPGYQYMDGQAVLDYCRQRHGSSDVARVERQQKMLMAIFDEVKNTGQIQDIPAIYSAITGNIYTDLDLTQIASLAAFAMQIGTENISMNTLPGGFLNIDGTSFWGINQSQKRAMVQEIFGVTINISQDDDVSTLKALAGEKAAAVTAANAAAAAAQGYVDANGAHITPEELADFNTRKAALLAVAAVKNTQDVGPTIAPIITETDAFSAWFSGLKTAVEQRKAEAAAAPTEPAASPQEPAPAQASQPAA